MVTLASVQLAKVAELADAPDLGNTVLPVDGLVLTCIRV